MSSISKELDDFMQLIFNGHRWAEAIKTRDDRLRVQTKLNALKQDLKAQRIEQRSLLGNAAFSRWLTRQSRYERKVNERMTEIVLLLQQDNPMPQLRRQMTELVDLVGRLAIALEGNGAHDDLLHTETIMLGGQRLSLFEVLESGRWDDRAPHTPDTLSPEKTTDDHSEGAP